MARGHYLRYAPVQDLARECAHFPLQLSGNGIWTHIFLYATPLLDGWLVPTAGRVGFTDHR